MSGIEALQKIVSWSNASEIDGAEREEFNQLVNGRSMIYAQVENHKTFCSDMRHSTGRLMDFNKGTFPSCEIVEVTGRHHYTWFRFPGRNNNCS